MEFLTLTLGQFMAIFGAVTAVSVALYLLDRSRRRQVVSTLRFWVAAEQPAVAARRRRIQQPWSLLLQLAGMALLLLAIAEVRLATQSFAPRDHIIVLDTSSWMAARSGKRTLMDLARERARAYLRAIPARDRVMLVRAAALPDPATAFELDRRTVDAAIVQSEPGATALHLDQALAFAQRVQLESGRRPGEIAFIGPGRIAERDPGAPAAEPRNLRVIAIPDAPENCGLRKIGLRRSTTDPDVWQIYVAVRNYGAQPSTITLALSYGLPAPAPARLPIAARRLTLPGNGETEAAFDYRTRSAGVLAVALSPHDAFPADDVAEIEVPAQPTLNVTVYSADPSALRSLLTADSRIAAAYRAPSAYRNDDRGLVILDRFIPPSRPTADSLWIAPPAAGSPIPVATHVEKTPFKQWNTAEPIAQGLRSKNFKLDSEVFTPASGDLVVGSVAAGPVVVARPATPRIAVLGFHPALSELRYELATPLLFANLMRWTSPAIFRRFELSIGTAGAVKLPLEDDTPAAAVKVTHEDGTPLPFTLRDRTLQFFTGTPGTVRVMAGDREYLYSLTLPELWDLHWTPPAAARHGVPRAAPAANAAADPWPWLALAGGILLLVEWLLYGRFRRLRGQPLTSFIFRRGKAAQGVRP